jgi:hypothetical protein
MAASLLCECVSTKTVVRTRFAAEARCPDDAVTVEEGATQYRARGCGRETTYVCGSTAGFRGGVQCAQEGLQPPPGYREPERPLDPRVVPFPR